LRYDVFLILVLILLLYSFVLGGRRMNVLTLSVAREYL